MLIRLACTTAMSFGVSENLAWLPVVPKPNSTFITVLMLGSVSAMHQPFESVPALSRMHIVRMPTVTPWNGPGPLNESSQSRKSDWAYAPFGQHIANTPTSTISRTLFMAILSSGSLPRGVENALDDAKPVHRWIGALHDPVSGRRPVWTLNQQFIRGFAEREAALTGDVETRHRVLQQNPVRQQAKDQRH